MVQRMVRRKSNLLYDEVQKQLDIYNNMDHVVIDGVLNARVGNHATENVTGNF